MSNNKFIGIHVFGEFSGVDPELLNDPDKLCEYLSESVRISGATVLNSITHTFTPTGVTVLILLQESHAALHTYPGQECAFFDIFTCGTKCDPEKAAYALSQMVNAHGCTLECLIRGDYERDEYDTSKNTN